MSSNQDPQGKLQGTPRQAPPPAAGMQRPFGERSPAAPPPRRDSASPTRAPMGWSLLLSVERARRALEEEMQTQAAMASKAAKTSEAEVALKEVKREVQEPSPRRTTGGPAGLNDDQEVYRLEQQVASLRKNNTQLLVRLQEQEEAHLKTNSDLRLQIESLESRLNAAENLNKFQVEENNKLRSSNIHLSQKLEKSQMENKAAIQKWCDKVGLLKHKVEKQKKYTSDLVHKLSKSTQAAGQVQEMEELVVWQRSRLKDQEAELSQLKGALAREKRRSASGNSAYPVESRRAARQDGVRHVETQTPSSCLQPEPECSVVLQVVSEAYPTAASIMRNYEELSLSLSALRSPVKAAIAAMPPATRSLCLKNMMRALQSEQTNADEEESSPSAKPCDQVLSPVSAVTDAGDASGVVSPKPSPPDAALPPPPFVLPQHLPLPPVAVPIDFMLASRKRAAEDDEAASGKQAVTQRISSKSSHHSNFPLF
ncbi:histone acetyltransferase KAT6A-like [Thrips palmi]|uniref:Histone acetyltransferase KAT6A-like n=1 Tax=Thrips palmi TaxID=161013 RepID=A0A6P8ZT59_THRPL|nr:histone acetyltransferase KAT6A-like [Thrips palmi]XP_034248288.1 histone acetyltransferase KAT6A-like [Thrips palmi]XP_034248296.1 histone acetyltransferase KAT6A-like [Thrips palmi]XP_034248304.1 histone acetyltransferase KAT6A-like [Thrips palmi]XP_034248312.1 histone acetyltransferase KAT6A-like [Thrips palmi]XP_034248322.1 histone acetyltransferase KAT6A-like [Thrips palmi]XP_034248329.1 histone acetyltransferase KAT6A-like [Thrips palmi]